MAIKPDVTPQEHQQRIADRLSGPDARLLLYGGLGTGKSLSAILAAERAKELEGGSYAIAAPASLRDNFKKELEKFTTDPSAEVMSYTGLGMGKEFQTQPDTLIGDEVQRLRNPSTASSKAFSQAARRAKRLLLLSGTPIVNAPSDLAAPMSMLTGQNISPTDFTDQFVGQRKVSPGLLAYLSGVSPGEESYIKNEGRLRRLLDGHVDYQPAAKPEGVDINEETVQVPMTPAQARLQEVIRKKIPTSFLWKLDRQFPLSRDESKRLNAFLVGLRQSSLSPRPFQAKPDNLEAFNQSGKLQEAMRRLKTSFGEDDRRKAIIYSNFIDAGLSPYAAALEREGIPAGMFHGGIPEKQRRETLDAYNRGKIKALLIGPAGAEGISTKGTSLIQLLDPHWNESRGNQAKGRGLRFDSHQDLPPELKNVLIQRYMSTMPEPGRFRRFFGARRERTGDEIVDDLAARKEALNEEFRRLLREVGSQKNAADPASQDGTYGSYFGSVLGNLGTGILASGLSGLASIPLTRNSMFTDNNPTSASRRAKEKIVRMLSKHLPVEHAGPAVASMIHTDPGTMKPTGARLGTNVHPATAAHEHGHVVQPRWINKLRKAGLFALPASLAGTFSTDEDTHRNLAMTSSAITGLSVLPSEIDASVRGYRTLSRMRKPMPLPGRLRAFAGLPSYFNAAMLPMLQHEVARRAGTFRTTSEAPAKQAEAPSAGSWLYNLLNTPVTGESAMQAAAAPGRAIHQTVAPAAKWWGDTTAAGYRGVGNLLGRGWNAVSNAVGSVGNAVGGAASAVGNTVAPTNAGSANAPAMTKDITDRMQSAGSAATWIPHPVTIGAGLVGMASPQIAGVVGGHMYNNMTPEMQAHQDIMAAERAGTSAAQMQPPSNRSPEYLKSFETYRSAAQSTADIQRAGGLKQWADQQSAARLKQQVEARRQAASQPSPGSSPSPQANIATQPTYQPPPQAYPVLPWRQAVAQNHPELVQRHPETAPTLPYDHGLGGRSSAAPTSNLASQPVKPPQPVQPPKPVQPPQPVKPPQPVQPPKPPSMASASMPKTPSSIGQPKTASTPILMLHQQAMKKYYASVAKDEKPKAKAAPKTPPPKPPQLNSIPPLDKPPQMGMSAGFGGQSLQQAINERFKIGANSSNTKMTNPLRQQRSNFGRSV